MRLLDGKYMPGNMTITKSHIINLGLIVHLITAFFSVGYHQCDELFQVFEFAGYKLGLNSVNEMPWEFASQMRSGLQPLLVYCITKLAYLISVTNPFYIALFLRAGMALLSFFAMVKFLRLVEEELVSERLKLMLWAFGLLFWCLPYFHARLSSENFASTLFLFALTLALSYIKKEHKLRILILVGVLLGLSFVCRFQFSFMIAGLMVWLIVIKRVGFVPMALILFGLLISVALGVLVDKWLYGNWVFSWWNYLEQNLFENKASIYGESPVYFYLVEALLQLIPPFSLIFVLVLFGFWVKRNTHVLTWITLPFILLHFFVAHKELRFLFPVLNFLPPIFLLYVQSFNSNPPKWLKFSSFKGFLKFAVIINGLLLIYFAFKPADETSKSLQKIYSLVKGDKPVLYYVDKNPYNKQASLNYFRNSAIKTIKADSAMILNGNNTYLYLEQFGGEEKINFMNGKFEKIYSSFPSWISHFNFNGWLNRANCYEIYRVQKL